MEDKLNDAWLQFAKDTTPPDNPAGDPPDVRTGADPHAAPTYGISLTEELQAAEIKEGLISFQKTSPVASLQSLDFPYHTFSLAAIMFAIVVNVGFQQCISWQQFTK